ncbi:hypothetical protein E4U17_005692 [Claviceps sp. LM77 group G4]|nr:hypothetical protein E4U17_005692 [Claviceps sp. LM77 group G4]KAG6074658.1 hypothetical protein E4U33_002415 [Claviceps sp. LM78 group G4]KAG6081744.1 hypothetical protein E4U16_007039 [Claviceps sp. LM84 group G4]
MSARQYAAACQSAGRLDQLPAELLGKVVLYLDVPSLTDFRRVNRRAMDTVRRRLCTTVRRHHQALSQNCPRYSQYQGRCIRLQCVVQNTMHILVFHVRALWRPYVIDFGRQADWGYFCIGCRQELEETGRHFRAKYTREGILGHMARYGSVKGMPRIPGRYLYVNPNGKQD